MIRPLRLAAITLFTLTIVAIIALFPWLKTQIGNNNWILFKNKTPSTIQKSQKSTPQANMSTSSAARKNEDPQIIEGIPCRGQPIVVNYPMLKDRSNTPFECKPFCTTRKTEQHFILYSDGFGAQCGIENCSDWGEDKCIICQVPDEVLAQFSLPKPEGDPPCKKKTTSSAAASSSGFISSIRTAPPVPVPWTPPAE